MKFDDKIRINEKLNPDNKTIFPFSNSFKGGYSKKKKTNLEYNPKEFGNINLIGQTTNFMSNINIYNEINYNNIYFLDDNFEMRKSSFNEMDNPENF